MCVSPGCAGTVEERSRRCRPQGPNSPARCSKAAAPRACASMKAIGLAECLRRWREGCGFDFAGLTSHLLRLLLHHSLPSPSPFVPGAGPVITRFFCFFFFFFFLFFLFFFCQRALGLTLAGGERSAGFRRPQRRLSRTVSPRRRSISCRCSSSIASSCDIARFRRPPRPPSHFLFETTKSKETKRKAPEATSARDEAAGSRRRGWRFRQPHPCADGKLARVLFGSPCGLSTRPPPRSLGTRNP